MADKKETSLLQKGYAVMKEKAVKFPKDATFKVTDKKHDVLIGRLAETWQLVKDGKDVSKGDRKWYTRWLIANGFVTFTQAPKPVAAKKAEHKKAA